MALGSDTLFADLLRHLRKAAGLTQAELAERAGLSVRGLNDLERGARLTPRRETVALLADALGLQGEERAGFLSAARRGARDAAPAPAAAPVPNHARLRPNRRPRRHASMSLGPSPPPEGA